MFEDFAVWEKLICPWRLAAGIPIAWFMWTSGLVKVAQLGRMKDEDSQVQQDVKSWCNTFEQCLLDSLHLLTFSYKLMFCQVTHFLHPLLCVERWRSKWCEWWHHSETPVELRGSKDDQRWLPETGARGCGFCCRSGLVRQTQMLLLKAALNLLFWFSVWWLTIENVGGKYKPTMGIYNLDNV